MEYRCLDYGSLIAQNNTTVREQREETKTKNKLGNTFHQSRYSSSNTSSRIHQRTPNISSDSRSARMRSCNSCRSLCRSCRDTIRSRNSTARRRPSSLLHRASVR